MSSSAVNYCKQLDSQKQKKNDGGEQWEARNISLNLVYAVFKVQVKPFQAV